MDPGPLLGPGSDDRSGAGVGGPARRTAGPCGPGCPGRGRFGPPGRWLAAGRGWDSALHPVESAR
jgi:hypothetical protein